MYLNTVRLCQEGRRERGKEEKEEEEEEEGKEARERESEGKRKEEGAVAEGVKERSAAKQA